MTPFGVFMRYWRTEKQATLAQLADYLAVSPAYLSALEHGKRGKPSFAMVDQICVYFELIWDDAEALKQAAQLSHPKPTINTSDLGPEAVRLANGLSQNIDRLSDDDCKALYEALLARL